MLGREHLGELFEKVGFGDDAEGPVVVFEFDGEEFAVAKGDTRGGDFDVDGAEMERGGEGVDAEDGGALGVHEGDAEAGGEAGLRAGYM